MVRRMKAKGHPPLTESAVRNVEKRIGFAIPTVLRARYVEERNGGFGPAGGVLGLVGGHCDDDGRSSLDLYERWCLKPKAPLWPEGVWPIAYAGCALYYCVDLRSPRHAVLLHDGNLADFSDGTPSKAAFLRTFKVVAPSVDAWLGKAGRPRARSPSRSPISLAGQSARPRTPQTRGSSHRTRPAS